MLSKIIIGSAQEEISLNKLTECVEKEIQEQSRLGKEFFILRINCDIKKQSLI